MRKKILFSILGCILLLLVISSAPKTQALLPNSFQVAGNEYFSLKFTTVNVATEPINGFGLTAGLHWLIKFTTVNSTGLTDSIYGEVFNDSEYYTQGGDWVYTNIFPNKEFKMADYDSNGVLIPIESNSSFVVPLVLPVDSNIYNDTSSTLMNNLSTYWKQQFNATHYLAFNFTDFNGSMGGLLSLPSVLPEYIAIAWHGNPVMPFFGEFDNDLLYITMYLPNGTLCYVLCAQWFAASNWTLAYKLMTPWLEIFDSMISGMWGTMFPGLEILDMSSIPGYSIEFVVFGITITTILIRTVKPKKKQEYSSNF